MSGLLPTNFMHWQGKSVPSEELASVPAPNTFINRQRDRTAIHVVAWTESNH